MQAPKLGYITFGNQIIESAEISELKDEQSRMHNVYSGFSSCALSTSCSSLISALKDETTRMHIVQSSSFILQPTPHTPNFGCTPLDSTSDSSQPGRNCRQPVKTPASHDQIQPARKSLLSAVKRLQLVWK